MTFSLPTGAVPSVAAALGALALTHNNFSERVAIGVRAYPKKDVTTWFVLTFASGAVRSVEVRELPKIASVESECSASVGLSALLATWCGTADEGQEGLLQRVADLDFFVVGDASIYIKSLAPITSVILESANVIRANSVLVP